MRTNGIPVDSIQGGINTKLGATTVDLFYRSNGAYAGATIHRLSNAARGAVNNGYFTLCNSSEANSTTTTDKKTSSNVYVSLANAATSLSRTFSATIVSSDYGSVLNADTVDGKHASDFVIKNGSRGELAGNETAKALSNSQTITAISPDCINLATSGAVTLTFTAAAANVRAVKAICLTASAATTLTVKNAVWANKGSAPAWGAAGKILVLLAHFVEGRVVLSVADNTQ